MVTVHLFYLPIGKYKFEFYTGRLSVIKNRYNEPSYLLGYTLLKSDASLYMSMRNMKLIQYEKLKMTIESYENILHKKYPYYELNRETYFDVSQIRIPTTEIELSTVKDQYECLIYDNYLGNIIMINNKLIYPYKDKYMNAMEILTITKLTESLLEFSEYDHPICEECIIREVKLFIDIFHELIIIDKLRKGSII